MWLRVETCLPVTSAAGTQGKEEERHYHEYQSSNDVLLKDAFSRVLQLPRSF